MKLGPDVLSGCLGLVLAVSSPSARAQSPPPDPQHRQSVVDLAYLLGQAHALHRACAGPDDDTWRSRMSRVLDVEAPDKSYRARMMSSFNAGFLAASAEHSTCTPAAQAAERKLALQGEKLSRRLATEKSQ